MGDVLTLQKAHGESPVSLRHPFRLRLLVRTLIPCSSVQKVYIRVYIKIIGEGQYVTERSMSLVGRPDRPLLSRKCRS
jgi:hypothetical protein